MTDSIKLTYQDAGVNIDAGNALVTRIKQDASHTHRPGVLGSLGGFGALFELPWQDYRQPVLVSGTDGVGSKLLLATQAQCFDTIGIDLVAMCANDVVVCGSEPLFFLDYYATGHLDVDQAALVIKGIANGCKQAHMALVGGETAELPGMYQQGDYDLAGFCVGIVEKNAIIDGSQVKPGDVLIGLASSGAHANGYSLIRHVLQQQQLSIDAIAPFDQHTTLADNLLAPTTIYVNSIRQLLSTVPIHAIAHITGGGLLENIPRTLPSTVYAEIDLTSWQIPPLFQWLATCGNIDEQELLRTFNCGIGMVLCVSQDHVDTCLQQLAELGETAWCLGHIYARQSNQAPVSFKQK